MRNKGGAATPPYQEEVHGKSAKEYPGLPFVVQALACLNISSQPKGWTTYSRFMERDRTPKMARFGTMNRT
jgi:hypothetical protein